MLIFMVLMNAVSYAQQSITITGTVKNASGGEALSAVSVTVKGSTVGTYTDENGNFKLTTTSKLPLKLVFSSVGFSAKEVEVTASNFTNVDVVLEQSYELGDDIVVSASRTAERILESPVSIERVKAADFAKAPAPTYYDVLINKKGVGVVTSSLTFQTLTTRGFNSSGNLRLNQIMDGMDNQAPGLNFSVGSVIGLTELDVESMELLAGASSALYGPGGMNGTIIVNSKNPFKYQGLSFQIKTGANHVDRFQRSTGGVHDWSVRWAKKVSDKFAFKIGAQLLQARDWLGNSTQNYSRTTGTPNGEPIPGWRESDPNYDGVNVYGDETTANLALIYLSTLNAMPGGPTGPFMTAVNNYLAANPTATLTQFNSFLNTIGGAAVVSGGASPILFGGHPTRNYYGTQAVSRTGYDEKNVIDPTTLNVKLQGALHYKLSNKVEAILAGYFGTGNTVYTGSDRYSLQNLKMAQYKFELKSDKWYVRAYTTQENAGSSFNATITTRLFNEAWKPSTTWYPQYAAAFSTARSQGAPASVAHAAARAFADQGRPTGDIRNHPLFQKVAGTPIKNGGGLFLDKTDLYMIEGQYNLVKTAKWDIIVGGNWKQYVLNSEGTLFADSTGPISINEVGGYMQVQRKLFNDKVKLIGSGRYDKNENFEGRFTPRVATVIELAKNHNLRASYQTAYRFPSTQNQWINLVIGGGTVLMGGLPQMLNYYGINNPSNPVYSLASVKAYDAGGPAPQTTTVNAVKPETSKSWEIGYKGLFGKKLLFDAYYYSSNYQNFISGVTVLRANGGFIRGVSANRVAYSIATNAVGTVKTRGWGVSMDYLLPKSYTLTANIYSDEMTEKPADPAFVSYFNAPKLRTNLGLSNDGIFLKKRMGFAIIYRWQDDFFYEGTFGSGNVPAYSTWDAVLTYKLPKQKSIIKFGGTNIFNRYYRTAWGNPQVGGLYYLSYGFNVL